jgi:hypothetical protein
MWVGDNMKNIKWEILVFALLISAAIVFYALSGRYYLDNNRVFDRFTGVLYKVSNENGSMHWQKMIDFK